MAATKSDVELKVDVLDVHVLDVLAQVESLLRHLREVQRCALRVRGAVPPGTCDDAIVAMKEAQERLATMLGDSDSLREAVHDISEAIDEVSDALTR